MRVTTLTALSALFTAPAFADVPKVVVDIAPVHSLVAKVMQGVGEPDLLLEGSASPHGYSMRPSDARALQNSDLLVWVGPGLTPWLEEAQGNLSEEGQSIALLGIGESVTFPIRDAIVFASDDHDEDHDHDHGHDDHDHGHDDHDHTKHDDHDHDDHDHAKEDDHDHGEHDDHDHDHAEHDHDHSGGLDPHAWLHPENARIWIGVIAETLSEIDPENAAQYAANAEAAQAEVTLVETEISGTLAGREVSGFAVYHDAFQYFEQAFGVRTLTSLSGGDGSQPSAARAAVLRDAIGAGQVTCVFSEPQFADRALRSVADGSETTVAVLDPLGAVLEPGPDLYPELLRDIAASISECS